MTPDERREGLARVIRDAYAADIIPADTLLASEGWSGIVGSVEEWFPEADAALAWFAEQGGERVGVEALRRLSQWIDDGNSERDAEALMLHRIIKVTEEAGEVVSALIGYLGANPRKGVTHVRQDVIDELLDVAVTALGAVEHLTGNEGRSIDALFDKIERVAARVLYRPDTTGGGA